MQKKILLNSSADSALVITNIDHSVKTLPVNSNQFVVPSPPNELTNDVLKRRFMGYAEVQTRQREGQYFANVADYVESGSTLTRYTDDSGIVHNAGLMAVYAIPSLAYYYFEEDSRETISDTEILVTLKLKATSQGDDYAYLKGIAGDRIVVDSSIIFSYGGSIDPENWLYDYLETRQHVYATPDTTNLIPYGFFTGDYNIPEMAVYLQDRINTYNLILDAIPLDHVIDDTFRLLIKVYYFNTPRAYADVIGYKVQNSSYEFANKTSLLRATVPDYYRVCIRPGSEYTRFDYFLDSWPFS